MPEQTPVFRAERMFKKILGQSPDWIVAAPGRVNLIGEHTDYNDGFVMPMAIERYTAIAAGLSGDSFVTIHSVTTGESARFNLKEKIQRGEPGWSNYVRGVVAGFQKRKVPVRGFEAVIESDVPLGGGLSSSAALEVATATLLEAMSGQKLEPVAKALLCQQAEHEFALVPCGIMDQFVSVMAQADRLLLLDCRSRATELVPVPDDKLTILIINTNVRHKLADGEYAKRRSECALAAQALKAVSLRDVTAKQLTAGAKRMDPIQFRRARHVVTENQRTLEAAAAFRAGDLQRVGTLMYASHASLRDDFEVSCRELDLVVDIARNIGLRGGVYGCRMTGGGFGGCAVALVQSEEAARITKLISIAYERQTRHEPVIFSSRPGKGAEIVLQPPPKPCKPAARR